MTLRARLAEARDRLAGAGIPAAEAALDAELLARSVLGWDRAILLARLADEVPPALEPDYAVAIERRVRREPVAYILGRQEFWGRDFRVAPGVLIPRPETELLVEEALDFARGHTASRLQIVDVGTGSGCLAVTLALELPEAVVEATDVSDEALAIAAANAVRHGAHVRFHHGPGLAGVAGPVDLIVANPPYITAADYPRLQPEVRTYEPETALVGGVDGLDVLRMVVDAAGPALAPGGRLVMEIGYDQAEVVGRIVTNTEWLELLRIRPDLAGTPRAVVATRRPEALTASG